jgi:hypothetical protein
MERAGIYLQEGSEEVRVVITCRLPLRADWRWVLTYTKDTKFLASRWDNVVGGDNW